NGLRHGARAGLLEAIGGTNLLYRGIEGIARVARDPLLDLSLVRPMKREENGQRHGFPAAGALGGSVRHPRAPPRPPRDPPSRAGTDAHRRAVSPTLVGTKGRIEQPVVKARSVASAWMP